MLDLANVTHETFEPCVRQPFAVEDDAGPLELELLSVETRGNFDPSVHKRQAFALLFRGPKEPVIGQQILVLSNETLGTLELFLVPIGTDEEGVLYEAVFT